MTGVVLGTLLLALLIGLVVLQGMIEWGGFDFDKFFKKKEKDVREKPAPKKKTSAKVKAKKPAKKKGAKKKGRR